MNKFQDLFIKNKVNKIVRMKKYVSNTTTDKQVPL